MKITFLGTGTSQGVPVIACECFVCRSIDPHDKRLRTSIKVEQNGQVFVVDTGPDFRQQMLRTKTKQLDAVIFTHEHKDHIAGLDDVRAFNFHQKRSMQVYAEPAVQTALKRDYYYAFSDEKYPGVPQIELNTIGTEAFEIGGTPIIPIRVMHYKMPVLGFRFGDFTYITDANYISDEEKEKVKGSKILVLNALRREDHISHFTLQQAIDLILELKPEKSYLTHISHMLGKHQDIALELPDNIELAYDGLELNL